MPQMSPILWLNLYVMFTITLMIFIAIFFYTKTPTLATKPAKLQQEDKLNWKW